jgi:hypothetical protein
MVWITIETGILIIQKMMGVSLQVTTVSEGLVDKFMTPRDYVKIKKSQ